MGGPSAMVSDAAFAAIWEAADDVSTVARLTGYTPGYCRWRACILRDHGWDLPYLHHGPYRLDSRPTDRFVAVWEGAASLDEVAQELGRPKGSCSTMASMLRAEGVPLKRFDGRKRR